MNVDVHAHTCLSVFENAEYHLILRKQVVATTKARHSECAAYDHGGGKRT